ncbi:MAG: permease, partial [Pseudomonadota bacterium]
MTALSLERPGSLGWFAAHEIRLTWRDWMSMMTAGKRVREKITLVGVLGFVAGLHLLAYALLREPFATGVTADKATLTFLTALGLLGGSLMLSQAIESVTRAFYARSDLDLILSSPASARALFSVRIAAIVLTTASLSLMMVLPFVVVAVAIDGVRWLAMIPTLFAAAACATAVAVLATIAMFKTLGARRTRLIAQIIAAVVGAAFLIGTQIAAIVSYGQMSRIELFSSAELQEWLPSITSAVWIPARAAMGQPFELILMVGASFALLAVVIAAHAGRFGEYVLVAASASEGGDGSAKGTTFASRSPEDALRKKEWRLLARDPWLVSQTLMQVLYLVPPAVLLWQNYGDETGAFVILAPVLVMAVGQLAGGLAWLAISGEDAPDLVASAPVAPASATTAKASSVLLVAIAAASPLLLALTFGSVWVALV